MSLSAIETKKGIVSMIQAEIQAAASVVVVQYRGLTVAQVTELRKKLSAEDVEFKVYKNSMVRRAAEAAGYGTLQASLVGPNAIAFGKTDSVAAARILAEFAKKNKALVLKSGIVEGKVLSTEEVIEISKLPGREGMYSMLLGCFQSPIRSFALAVKAVAEAKEA